jgi:hypothetical protein
MTTMYKSPQTANATSATETKEMAKRRKGIFQQYVSYLKRVGNARNIYLNASLFCSLLIDLPCYFLQIPIMWMFPVYLKKIVLVRQHFLSKFFTELTHRNR